MKDEQIRELFSEMREEAIPAESLARVRRAVAESVPSRRRWFGWKFAAMVAVAGCLAVAMVELRTAQVPVNGRAVQGPVVAVQQSAPVVEAAPVLPVAHKAARPAVVPVREVEVRRTEKAPPVSSDNGGAHEIRIESSDEPDVVILLIGG
ncbi:MAG TPA: hypothetical protein VGN17_06280 [Bryobacteraceae bacterium]|jgi:hypothetical protein